MGCGKGTNLDSGEVDYNPGGPGVDNPLPYDSEEILPIVETKVRNGKAADLRQFPYQVSLQNVVRSVPHFCGASIIHPLILLTAAHCFIPENSILQNIRALSGKHNILASERTEQIRNVTRLIKHENWNETTKDNDIALLVLDTPLEFDGHTGPIRIPQTNGMLPGIAEVSGWGYVSKTVTPEILQAAKLYIHPTENCTNTYAPSGYTVTDNMICAGGVVDTCQGDSGGPLSCRSHSGETFLCGIVSWGSSGCQRRLPGLYTNVPKYHPWIIRHVQEIVKNHPHMQRRTECDTRPRSYPHVTCTTCQIKGRAEGGTRAYVDLLRLQVDIEYRYSRTQVTSVMINPSRTTSEDVTFSVYLPNTAFISNFSMAIDGSSYDAKLKERAAAWLLFNQNRQDGRTAGIVEASSLRENLFNVTANVGPRKVVTFTLTYEELLPRRNDMYEQSIHIDVERVREARSYEIMATIIDSQNITGLRAFGMSSTLKIHEEIEDATVLWDGNVGTISWSLDTSKPHIPQRFVLQYNTGTEAGTPSGQILIRDGYLAHFFSPTQNIPPFEKHVIIVMELSGSMNGAGTVLSQLKEGVVHMLSGLHLRDRLSIITFDDNVQTFREDVGRGQVRIAKSLIPSLRGNGGSNLHGALIRALNLAATIQSKKHPYGSRSSSSTQPLIVLFSTGNVASAGGISNKTVILSEVAAANLDQGVPIYSLAYGPSSDFQFLRKLSLQNNGFARKVFPESDHALQLKEFYTEIHSPLLLDLNFSYKTSSNATFKVSDLTATSFPSYFKQSSLVVLGKLEKSNSTASNNSSQWPGCNEQGGNTSLAMDPLMFNATVQGRSKDGLREFPSSHPIDCSCLLDETTSTSSFMERLWAYLKVKEVLQESETMTEDQLNEIRNRGCEEPGVYAQRLALEYGFVTPVTSLVVVQPNVTDVVVDLPEKNVLTVKGGTRSGAGGARQIKLRGHSTCHVIPTRWRIRSASASMNATTEAGTNNTSSAVNPFGNSLLNGTLLYSGSGSGSNTISNGQTGFP